MSKPLAGVLGGLGPMATVYFMSSVLSGTYSLTDQDHVDMIVWNQGSIPDRTAYLIGASDDDPLPHMIAAAQALENSGATFIAMPCNTAHHYYDALAASVTVPFLNIVEETIAWAQQRVPGVARVGVLATDGTVRAGTYERWCEEAGLECVLPEPQVQSAVMSIIYDGVKAGRSVTEAAFRAPIDHLRQRGCDVVVLGCTELSMVYHDLDLHDPDLVDSLDALARATIRAGGKTLRDEH